MNSGDARAPSGWSIQPLGALLREVDLRLSDLAAEERDLEVLSLTKRFGLVPQAERFDKRVATENVDNYKVVRPGWIAYNPYVLWEGAIHALRRQCPGIVSPVYPVWERIEPDDGYLDFVLRTPELLAIYESLSAGAVNRRRTIRKEAFSAIEIPVPSPPEQRQIAAVLALVREAKEQQQRLMALTEELKRAFAEKLLSEGLRKERQKKTQIGKIPASWVATPLSACCDILNGSISYQRFVELPDVPTTGGAVTCMAVKVSDMNLLGNSSRFVTANVMRRLPDATAKKLVPPGAVVFPKRGAAIATNKKRLTTMWTALDPNLIALHPKLGLSADFLFLWAQTFDLREITAPGPTPQLNKKDLSPLLIPLPQNAKEQAQICAAVKVIDTKVNQHLAKEHALASLFDALVYQLTTGQVRIAQLDLKEAKGEASAAV